MTGLIERLNKHGYAEKDTKKILGENFLLVFARVWR
jgi:microsomal dipeptidase-like Zn-dependent dipeptidase